MSVIEEIVSYASKIASHEIENVYPGMNLRFTEACTVNDRIWQGDLALTVATSVPKEYKLAEDFDGQLVKGNNQGARHCLDSTDGVEVYLPPGWNEESLDGPFLVFNREATILHPKHGNVTVPVGFIINCTYQREHDKELQRERRAKD